jgi:L-seryl-tRNA(Ser) seleniumtransferase
MGAGASGMRGRDPNAAAHDEREERHSPRDPNSFGFAVWQLKEGEDKMIANRLVEIFKEATKAGV